jgi:predicted transcriptional regulator
MKYRSRTDITAQILESANGSSTKTKIMYKAFLSYAQLKEYITMLVDNGLLEYNSAEQTYKTSPKGLKFLQVYGKMGEFVQQVEADTSPPHIKR